MDYWMPRMDGVEAAKEIRKHFPDLPVLFVSAWDETEVKEAAFEAGPVEYLVVAPMGCVSSLKRSRGFGLVKVRKRLPIRLRQERAGGPEVGVS